MESTAQYWKPVWEVLERSWKALCQSREGAGRMSGTLHLAQALSNRGRRGRTSDFRDAERFVKRLLSEELVLSFVPDAEQRLWRTLTRTRYQRTRDKVRLQNQLEALLEEAHIKLSSLVSDLLGASARRMLKALADGETDPAALAAMADQRLRATPAQLHDALGACTEINPVYRRLVKMTLDDLQFVEQQISQLDQEIASLLQRNQDAVERLAVVPGLGVDLAFFYDASQVWGFDPLDRGHCRVLFYPEDVPLTPADFPESLTANARFPKRSLEFRCEWTLPKYLELNNGDLVLWKTDEYRALIARLNSDGSTEREPVHRFGGYPQEIQGDMRLECQLVTNGIYCGGPSGYQDPRRAELEKGSSDWQLLTQFDSDEARLGWMWGDVGRVYFWARQQDIEATNFTNSWAILQCH
jgi:uncharacterized protein YwqG